MYKQSVNPLRISHETLDLDDIISDLNEGNQRSTIQVQDDVEETKRSATTTNSTTSVAQSKSNQPKTSSTLKTRGLSKGITKQPVTTTTTTAVPNNKENQSKASNDSQLQVKGTTLEKQQQQPRDFLVSTTTETKTQSSQPNERYADFNYKNYEQHSDLQTQEDQESASKQRNYTPSSVQEAPFYMNRSVASITDEDVEGFQKKLDTLILNFRSETLSEFMRTKKQVLHDQASTIDAERRRCNTLLGVKQNEIEQLKESLASKTKLSDELGLRCEIMAIWAGKGKTLAKMKVLQYKCFNALKLFRDFKKHSKTVLKLQLQRHKQNTRKRAFLCWEKHYRDWKIQKNKDDFDKAVKSELQHICAQYSKEIESLRQKLEEANTVVDQENRNKAMMQENLKKAFMRGVCALNFEAMNILNPNDMSMQNQIEKEMEKQVQFAMNGITGTSNTPSYQQHQTQSLAHESRSPQQMQYRSSSHTQQMTDYSYSDSQSEQYQSERKIMQIEQHPDMDYKKIETKDSLWKPAPIMGREISQETGPTFTYAQPSITSTLRTQQQQQSYVLPSHFRQNEQMMQQEQYHIEPVRLDTYTEDRTIQNTQIITNASTLPNFIGSSLPQFSSNQQQPSEGKTIYANNTSQIKSTQGKTVTSQTKKTAISATTGTTIAQQKKQK